MRHRQPVADHAFKPQPLRHRIGELVKAAGYQHRLRAVRLQRGDQRARAGHVEDALIQTLLDRVLAQPAQQPDPLGQRLGKVEFTLHRAFGDVGDLVLQAREVGQFIDAFGGNHGRIHVGYEHPRHARRVIADQQVHRRKLCVEHAAQGGGGAVIGGDFQHVVMRGQRLGPVHFQARRFERVDRRVTICGKPRGFCYQAGNEHV